MLVYLLLVNVLTFTLMLLDKNFAKAHRRRIPERTLILTAVLGGSLGELLGMWVFHHKTKHPKFYITLPVLLGMQLGLLAWWYGR